MDLCQLLPQQQGLIVVRQGAAGTAACAEGGTGEDRSPRHMAAARKLQSEIDRTLKKINEGNEAFDEIWEKVYSAPSASQK